jgi:hypothetical protein
VSYTLCLAGKLQALVDALDQGYLLRRDIERILGRGVTLHNMTDSKSLFDTITNST